MKEQLEFPLLFAASTYSWAQAGDWLLAKGPAILTLVYLVLKIYFKLKNELKKHNEKKKSKSL